MTAGTIVCIAYGVGLIVTAWALCRAAAMGDEQIRRSRSPLIPLDLQEARRRRKRRVA